MARHLHATAAALVLLSTTFGGAQAQSLPDSRPGWEIVVPAGRLFPTGAQRELVARGGLNAVQISYVRPSLAFTGTFGWARSRDFTVGGEPKLDVFLFDVGPELRADRWLSSGRLSLSPFAGMGAGTRVYNRRGPGGMSRHVTAYGGGGVDLGYRRVHLRAEARDYLSGIDARRNDVVAMIGLRIAGSGR